MTNIRKTIALLLCLCMLWGTAALAEDAAAATDTATTAVTELNDTDVLATVNGEEVSWDEVKSLYSSLVSQYGSAYDLTQQANVDLFRAVALENRLTEVLMEQKAKEFGVDQLTDEEIADLESQADTNWEDAIANYEAYFYPDLTEESSEEEKAAAREEAINYYKDQGYTLESLREEYKRYGVLNKIADIMVQDATVTDQEVEDLYQSLVAADKELYENDIAAYEAYNSYVDQMAMYAALYGTSSNLDHAWYKPDGFRAVKHILLPVDSELMTTYTDLQARWEEQQEAAQAAEESAGEAAETTTDTAATEATAEPTATPCLTRKFGGHRLSRNPCPPAPPGPSCPLLYRGDNASIHAPAAQGHATHRLRNTSSQGQTFEARLATRSQFQSGNRLLGLQIIKTALREGLPAQKLRLPALF